jgi:hypothetical protein
LRTVNGDIGKCHDHKVLKPAEEVDSWREEPFPKTVDGIDPAIAQGFVET